MLELIQIETAINFDYNSSEKPSMSKKLPSIAEFWQTDLDELSQIVHANPSLRGMMMGYLAEFKLQQWFHNHSSVSRLYKDDDHDRKRKGDLVLTYKGREFKIEAKSLQTNSIRDLGQGRKKANVQCDASDCRTIRIGRNEVRTTCLVAGEFDILAICLFGFTGRWDFGFALNNELPRTTSSKYTPSVQRKLIKSLFAVTWPLQPPFSDNPFELMNRLLKGG